MDTSQGWSVVIPAPAPARVAKRLLTAGLFGVMTGSLNHGLLEAGETVELNEKIKVPSVCNLCGTNPGTRHTDLRQDVTFSDVGALLGGPLLGQAKLVFKVPLCETCVSLPGTPGVSLQSYGKRGDEWEVTLLVVNEAVAALYASANPGASVSAYAAAPTPAADGRRSARLSFLGAGWSIVTDGVPGKMYGAILKNSLVISEDGRHVAYVAKVGGNWVGVVDGVEGKPYHLLAGIALSPDGARIGLLAQIDGRWSVVVDGVEGKAYDDLVVNSLAFSADGTHVAFGAKIGGRFSIVVDGIEGPTYEALAANPVAFSPDGTHVAFGARFGDKWTVVVDGLPGAPYDGLTQGSPSFSPDGRRVAFGVKAGNKWTVVVDGVPGKPYDGLLTLRPMILFSADSRRVAYGAKLDCHTVTFVVDGFAEGRCESIAQGSLAFSPDNEHVTYRGHLRGHRAGEWTTIVDGSRPRPDP
jgi:hypothetical protein